MREAVFPNFSGQVKVAATRSFLGMMSIIVLESASALSLVSYTMATTSTPRISLIDRFSITVSRRGVVVSLLKTLLDTTSALVLPWLFSHGIGAAHSKVTRVGTRSPTFIAFSTIGIFW